MPLGGLKYEYRCKICRLSETQPDLFRRIHSLMLEDRVSATQTMKIVNAEAAAMGIPGWQPINAMNISGHFRNHVDVEAATAQALTLYRNKTSLAAVNPEAADAVDRMVHRRIGTELRDHDRLEELYEDLYSKTEILSDQIERHNNSGSDVDIEAMRAYKELVKELRSIIVDVNKIRRSGRLMTQAIESLLHQMLTEIAQRVTSMLSEHSDKLASLGVDRTEAIKITHTMRIDMMQMMADVARAAVSDILKTYKISMRPR